MAGGGDTVTVVLADGSELPFGPVTPRLAQASGLPEDGVLIGQVVEGAPADEAGLAAGDAAAAGSRPV